jgi:hypothetical protein
MQPGGSEISLLEDTSHQAMLTSVILDPFAGMTSEDILSVISSQASPDGVSPSDLQDGLTIDLFGQALAPASPSAQPEKAKHQAMNATSGPTGSSLSGLADRQSSLANRLKRQLDGAGSTLFTLTWKQKATPLGRPYYQLAASARRISDNDCGSWPTPRTTDGHGSKEHGNGGQALHTTASWATPTSRDHKDGASTLENTPVNALLGRQVLLSGFPAQTESKGQLNPAFSLWLMGYPPEWLSCAPQATRSSRKSRQSS